jgi:hypothetical protein
VDADPLQAIRRPEGARRIPPPPSTSPPN